MDSGSEVIVGASVLADFIAAVEARGVHDLSPTQPSIAVADGTTITIAVHSANGDSELSWYGIGEDPDSFTTPEVQIIAAFRSFAAVVTAPSAPAETEPGELRSTLGTVFIEGDRIHICTALLESAPPQCPEPGLNISGLDPALLDLYEGWTPQEVTLVGSVDSNDSLDLSMSGWARLTAPALAAIAVAAAACNSASGGAVPTPTTESAGIVEPPPTAVVWLGVERIDELQRAIADGAEPVSSAADVLRAAADRALDHEPSPPALFDLVGVYDVDPLPDWDVANRRAIKTDTNAAYAAGLAYALIGEESYADAVLRIVGPWTTDVEYGTDEEPRLNFALHFPGMIIAVDLMRGSQVLTSEWEEEFSAFLTSQATLLVPTDPNNHSDWGLLLVRCVHPGRRAPRPCRVVLDQTHQRPAHHRRGPPSGGRPPRRVGDRGINYSHVTLHAMTLSAEVLAVNGRDVFDYESPDGKSLRLAYETLTPWVVDPATFPFYVGPSELGVDKYAYWEILDRHWPHDDAEALLATRRPIETLIGFDAHLTLTHGRPTT